VSVINTILDKNAHLITSYY